MRRTHHGWRNILSALRFKDGRAASSPSIPASTAVAMAQAPAIPVMPESYYGGFWIRLVAHLIDRAVLGVVFVPGFFIFILPAIIAAHSEGALERGHSATSELIRSVALFIFFAIGCTYVLRNFAYQFELAGNHWQKAAPFQSDG